MTMIPFAKFAVNTLKRCDAAFVRLRKPTIPTENRLNQSWMAFRNSFFPQNTAHQLALTSQQGLKTPAHQSNPLTDWLKNPLLFARDKKPSGFKKKTRNEKVQERMRECKRVTRNRDKYPEEKVQKAEAYLKQFRDWGLPDFLKASYWKNKN